jgi:hypothetical protein
MKKLLSSSLIALSITFGSASLPSQNANAGIIIGCATATIIGPLIGLTLSSAGFFWGIQSEGINPGAAILFVLNKDLESGKLTEMIANRYPELDSYLVEELSNIVQDNASNVDFNEKGLKEVVVSVDDLSTVLDVLAVTNSALAEKIRLDFTQPTLKNI